MARRARSPEPSLSWPCERLLSGLVGRILDGVGAGYRIDRMFEKPVSNASRLQQRCLTDPSMRWTWRPWRSKSSESSGDPIQSCSSCSSGLWMTEVPSGSSKGCSWLVGVLSFIV